jgi:hypothetical protein
MIRVRRIYDRDTDTKGYRVLVDRLWPRGVRKDEVDLWLGLKRSRLRQSSASGMATCRRNGPSSRNATSPS